MSCHDIDFITFHRTGERDLRRPLHKAFTPLGCQISQSDVRIEIKFLSNLFIRQIQSHKIQAEDPNTQRFVVTGEVRESRVRSISDPKRMIGPDWMDCIEAPETQDEPTLICRKADRILQGEGVKATGNNYFTCISVAFGLMVMSYFGRVAERCRRASINFISLAGTRTPSG